MAMEHAVDSGRVVKQSAGQLVKSFNIAEYSHEIGDLSKLEEAIKLFENMPSAMGKDGPLRKVLECGKKGGLPGELNTARGAMYELERAVELSKQGEIVTKLGEKITVGSMSREFDIVTNNKLIECKNIDWTRKVGNDANKMKGIFGEQKKIAQQIGKVFEVHSRNIPNEWKSWFIEIGIQVVEG